MTAEISRIAEAPLFLIPSRHNIVGDEWRSEKHTSTSRQEFRGIRNVRWAADPNECVAFPLSTSSARENASCVVYLLPASIQVRAIEAFIICRSWEIVRSDHVSNCGWKKKFKWVEKSDGSIVESALLVQSNERSTIGHALVLVFKSQGGLLNSGAPDCSNPEGSIINESGRWKYLCPRHWRLKDQSLRVYCIPATPIRQLFTGLCIQCKREKQSQSKR